MRISSQGSLISFVLLAREVERLTRGMIGAEYAENVADDLDMTVVNGVSYEVL
jgi:hypothetical protein